MCFVCPSPDIHPIFHQLATASFEILDCSNHVFLFLVVVAVVVVSRDLRCRPWVYLCLFIPEVRHEIENEFFSCFLEVVYSLYIVHWSCSLCDGELSDFLMMELSAWLVLTFREEAISSVYNTYCYREPTVYRYMLPAVPVNMIMQMDSTSIHYCVR